jgi:hypothetical protein
VGRRGGVESEDCGRRHHLRGGRCGELLRDRPPREAARGARAARDATRRVPSLAQGPRVEGLHARTSHAVEGRHGVHVHAQLRESSARAAVSGGEVPLALTRS